MKNKYMFGLGCTAIFTCNAWLVGKRVDVFVFDVNYSHDFTDSKFLFVCLRLNVLVNNFSVILGRLPGFNQY